MFEKMGHVSYFVNFTAANQFIKTYRCKYSGRGGGVVEF